jgi:hypothetical protein
MPLKNTISTKNTTIPLKNKRRRHPTQTTITTILMILSIATPTIWKVIPAKTYKITSTATMIFRRNFKLKMQEQPKRAMA